LKDLFERKAGMDVVGILGYDFMSRFVTRVGYSRERLSFYDPDTFVCRGPGKTLAAPLVDYPFALQNGFLDLPGVEIMGGGAGADARERSARLQAIEIGDFVIDRPLMSGPLENQCAYLEEYRNVSTGESYLYTSHIYTGPVVDMALEPRFTLETRTEFDDGRLLSVYRRRD
jgi:hypothetical protein